jgi:hypothetical protein
MTLNEIKETYNTAKIKREEDVKKCADEMLVETLDGIKKAASELRTIYIIRFSPDSRDVKRDAIDLVVEALREKGFSIRINADRIIISGWAE